MSHPFRALAPSRLSDRLSSLILHWNSDDQSIDCLSGQVGTFERTTLGGAMVDAGGGVWQSVRKQARWDMVLDAQSGLWRPGLLLEPARANLLFASEDFSGWTNIGTCDVGTGDLLGDLQLIRLTDDAAGTLEGRSKTISFTNTGVKTIRAVIKESTSTSAVIRLRDTTAAANRLLATITWTAGVPTATMTTGTFIGKRQLGSAWELLFQTTSVTHTPNTNQIEVYPATTSGLAVANTGIIQAGGMGAYDSLVPRSYIKTTGSSVTAQVETLTWPFALPRRRVWMYLAFTELGSFLDTSVAAGYAALGAISGGSGVGLGLYPSFGNGYSAFHYVGATGPTVAVNASFATFGQLVELLVTMGATGIPTLTVARDGVEVGSATAGSAPSDMTSGFTDAIARLGAFGSSATHVVGGAAYHALKVGEYGLSTPTLAKARRYW